MHKEPTTDVLTAEELDGLLRLAASATTDRRVEKRDDVRLTLLATLLATPDHPAITINTCDLSASGMGFLSPRSFETGEHFAVHIELGRHSGRLVLCRTCNCLPVDGGLHRTGVEFIEMIAGDGVDEFPHRWIELARAEPNE
jgi:hypothetical protein